MTDPFLHHEALDRANLLAEAFDRQLARHPFIQAQPALAARCEAISTALAELYQAVGTLETAGTKVSPQSGGAAGNEG